MVYDRHTYRIFAGLDLIASRNAHPPASPKKNCEGQSSRSVFGGRNRLWSQSGALPYLHLSVDRANQLVTVVRKTICTDCHHASHSNPLGELSQAIAI
ncbi:hypothetical protein M404DRAFT_648158 [Pisolithus tinctorius Marx 270]|uniref:Uncharacterized protein n=1 Tax=Pisolithus tinctorius Marx 270 TaxID=870435 RepID=A0A0C3NNM0_PISTI|nr:hypothetical protein M404DRAFT_648158 [Pisolithus tinctorius Marx 270]